MSDEPSEPSEPSYHSDPNHPISKSGIERRGLYSVTRGRTDSGDVTYHSFNVTGEQVVWIKRFLGGIAAVLLPAIPTVLYFAATHAVRAVVDQQVAPIRAEQAKHRELSEQRSRDFVPYAVFNRYVEERKSTEAQLTRQVEALYNYFIGDRAVKRVPPIAKTDPGTPTPVRVSSTSSDEQGDR